MNYVIDPVQVEFWSLNAHTAVSAKLLADGKNMTVLYTTWGPGATAPEHTHPHEQMGLCLQGEAVFVIDGTEYLVQAGQFYHIPGNVPHAERNDGDEPAILVDFFSPPREDLLRKRFEF
ncbi:MAG: cupin domain-containing protein [Ardenticatenaceae bacterium]|nr:cupin domain-containing protein [Ardenticatenaceae bacterium]MCB9443432.1 cupin domain-containing protein [Ardenticatenaceae bacterium]